MDTVKKNVLLQSVVGYMMAVKSEQVFHNLVDKAYMYINYINFYNIAGVID